MLSPSTIACRARALKAFASWLSREGYTMTIYFPI
jgi:hypothetical protein